MKLKLLVFLLLSFGIVKLLFAQQPVIVKTEGAAPGTYYLVMTIAEDGTVSISTLDGVVVFSLVGETPTDPPNGDDPEEPEDPEQDVLKEKVTKLLGLVQDPNKAKTSEVIAKIYQETAKLAANGAIKNKETLRKAVDLVYAPALAAAGKVDEWKAFKKGVDVALDAAESLEELQIAYETVAAVLDP